MTMDRIKERFCCNCGASMGMIRDAHYERNDTCGAIECESEMRDAEGAERIAAHERLDDDMGY